MQMWNSLKMFAVAENLPDSNLLYLRQNQGWRQLEMSGSLYIFP